MVGSDRSSTRKTAASLLVLDANAVQLDRNGLFSTPQADVHENGLKGLIDLNLPAVICSRPVWNGKRLANEAFVRENGVVRPLHRKQYFPNEPGWFESEWYSGDDSGFDLAEVLG
jgi:hypothetical protein